MWLAFEITLTIWAILAIGFDFARYQKEKSHNPKTAWLYALLCMFLTFQGIRLVLWIFGWGEA